MNRYLSVVARVLLPSLIVVSAASSENGHGTAVAAPLKPEDYPSRSNVGRACRFYLSNERVDAIIRAEQASKERGGGRPSFSGLESIATRRGYSGANNRPYADCLDRILEHVHGYRDPDDSCHCFSPTQTVDLAQRAAIWRNKGYTKDQALDIIWERCDAQGDSEPDDEYFHGECVVCGIRIVSDVYNDLPESPRGTAVLRLNINHLRKQWPRLPPLTDAERAKREAAGKESLKQAIQRSDDITEAVRRKMGLSSEFLTYKGGTVFHLKGCSRINHIRAGDLITLSSWKEANGGGRRPCKKCNP